MENLIYLVVVIAYFIWQAQQGRKKGQVKRDAENQPVEQDGRRVREVRPITIEEKMREIFREVEMKQKPFARPEKQVSDRRDVPPAPPVVKREIKPAPKVVPKKAPSPFLNIDMTTEEIAPEGTWTAMGADRFSKIGYDYNKVVAKAVIRKVNLREAIIGKIILDRPEW